MTKHVRSTPPHPRGAVFISYRHNDGAPAAVCLAWALRAVGIPVWHDLTDLPPGDTVHVIREALTRGLSGAVLVVTDDIRNSPVVKKIEWPTIRELATQGNFTLGILNSINSSTSSVYGIPDQLLRRRQDRILGRYPQHIKGLKQYRFAEGIDELDSIAVDMLRQRLKHLRPSIAERGFADIDLATRADPSAEYAEGADLSFRWNRTETRDTHETARQQLQHSFHLAASALREHTSGPLRFRGQTHLSFGLAIGASLTLGPEVQFANEDGIWTVREPDQPGHPTLVDTRVDQQGGSGPILIYLDLVGPESDAAYNAVSESRAWSERLVIRRRDAKTRIAASDGNRLAHELADIVRAASGRNGNGEVHLLLRTPLSVALLTGTLLNTLTVTVYEWSQPTDDYPARYLPAFRLRPGERNVILNAM